MKLDLFECDLCKKEHRRSTLPTFMYKRDSNSSVSNYYRDLCSACEEAILDLIKNLERKP